MDYTTLGSTGLRVSRMGLGCGGPSQLGLRGGGSEANAEAVVSRALDLGVNFFDTAETYRTEEVLGRALKAAPREAIVIASKKAATDRDGQFVSGGDFLSGVDRSLSRMGIEYLDLHQIHALTADEYDHAITEIVPAMMRAREAGKIRHIGVTEEFIPDSGHQMLSRALAEGDSPWEVVMTGFNMLNPSARERVFSLTRKKRVGTLIMFAVRRALSQVEKLRELLEALEKKGILAPGVLPQENPLSFLLEEGGAGSIPEAAYRFCRHEPGADVILVGTGSVEHLVENARAISSPPLPEEMLARLSELFGSVDCVSGN